MKNEEGAIYRIKEVTEQSKIEKREKEDKKKEAKTNILGLND